MIALIDSGGANIASVLHALERLDARGVLTGDPETIRTAERVILPGVGMAGDAMKRLGEKNLIPVIRALKQPVLGICLGMQLLFEHSEEGDADMLGLLPGAVRRFDEKTSGIVPHMGWNEVAFQSAHPLVRCIPDRSHFYFVHSYFAPPGLYTVGICEYGAPFSAIVARDNFMGCQFHPERSGAMGAAILKNFLEIPA